MMIRSLACVLVLLMLSFAAPTQSKDSNCDLSVRVVTRDERGVEGQIQVEVLSREGTTIATVHVNGEEPVQFRVANGNSYGLRVSGAGIKTVTTPHFEIIPLELAHSEIVYVQPENQTETTDSKPAGTISVSEMNIPKRASSEMNKGLEAFNKGDMEKAAIHFEKAAADYPQYARAYDNLGVIAVKSSNRVKARELFLKSIQVDDKFAPAYVNLARMDLQDKNYAESESLLNKVLAVNPLLAEALALLAGTEFANKEYEKALVDVERAHALPNHEQFAEVHIMAGKVLAMQNHPEAAMAQFQLFLTEKPDSPETESVRKQLATLKVGQQR
jgi:tetratricopeptide (TPR) repeat protein